MKKNTFVFLLCEGIGLNKKCQGNYLKLAAKPNINYLISGIYPWSVIANNKTKKHKKTILQNHTIIDHNFYQLLYGTDEIKPYTTLFAEAVQKQTLDTLPVFAKLQKHNNRVHVFCLFSSCAYKFYYKNLYYVINVLIKKKLTPIIHLVCDGQNEKTYNFYNHILDFTKFLLKRHLQVASIAGRNHVFGKWGQDYKQTDHIIPYVQMLRGFDQSNTFFDPIEYAAENLTNQVNDADILPALNQAFYNSELQSNDALLFLNSDPDDFASLAYLIKNQPKLENILYTSFAPVYGSASELFFESPIEPFTNQLLINQIAKKSNYNTLLLSLVHKKGFIMKFFGNNHYANITRKVLKVPYTQKPKDYYAYGAKLLIDKTIASFNQYDFIFIHIPIIAEAAQTANLSDLKFAIEVFDKNLGRLLNLCKATGSIIAFTSAYGAAEKMLNNKFHITPQNTTNPTPFVFTNGLIAAKKIQADFISVYASLLSTLDVLDPQALIIKKSLISANFTKKKIENTLNDAYAVWKDTIATPLIKDFEHNHLSLYADFVKATDFLSQKRKYIVFKELLKISEQFLLTSQARKKIYEQILAHLETNQIDFFGFCMNYLQILESLFAQEIALQKLTKTSNKYFDRKILNTNFKRNIYWVTKIVTNPQVLKQKLGFKANQVLLNENNFIPYLFFEKLWQSEIKVLATNNAQTIFNFYALIQEEVKKVYETFVLAKINKLQEEGELEEKERKQQQSLFYIKKHYEYFVQICELIQQREAKLVLYDKKYAEKIASLHDKSLLQNSLWNIPDYLLNRLVKRILNLYRLYNNELQSFVKKNLQPVKQKMYAYDHNYELKVNLAYNSIVYEGEFEEAVNLYKQNQYKKMFADYVHLYQEFDNTNWTNEPQIVEVVSEDEFDQEGNLLDLAVIYKNISFRSDYNRAYDWVQSQKQFLAEQHLIRDNVVIDAENKVNEGRKYKGAQMYVQNYQHLAQKWTKKHKNKQKCAPKT